MTSPEARLPDRRTQVLDFVRAAKAPVSLVEVAESLGIHVNTARFHMNTLVANGQVEPAPAVSGAAGRPAGRYRPAPGMDPMGTRDYRSLAAVLTTVLPAGSATRRRALKAGQAWGRSQAARADAAEGPDAVGEAVPPAQRLVRMLDGMGFAPERRNEDRHDRGAEIRLRNCPFAELAAERSDLVCEIHLGMMRGALETWGADETVESLTPFSEPGTCVARLAQAGRR